ncbi:MAG: hypothetical protein K8R87_05635 [Verrucomicrobia bacterium]|nr:hypothetical protein [Verrucomicrobiota bacterium]
MNPLRTVLSLFAALLLSSCARNPGPFDRKLLEALVEQVRVQQIAPGETKEFRLVDMKDAKSLRSVGRGQTFPRGENMGRVWAERAADRTLKVVIETQDLGHAGEYGFAYSDSALQPISAAGQAWMTLDVPGKLVFVQPQMKIDDHWWQVLNNLD